ncbi:MAG: outer membrane protein transport protein [Proteiniphilum sp.]|nr:outer membrane protein transport protein [Proteiniphilum sp.]
MKKITYILFSLFILSAPLFSQSEVDALRFSREDLYGTARAMSMGGAFGALGGDQTGISINPAGIAIYRSSEVVGTLNMSSETSTVGGYDANKTRFNLDNFGFVGYFPLRNDVMPLVNFGFSYDKVKSFDKNISAFGSPRSTLIDFIYDDYQIRSGNGAIGSPDDLVWVEDEYDPFLSQPWLPALGRNSFLLHPNQEGSALIPLKTGEFRPDSELGLREKGYISKYNFTAGTAINNVLNLGVALTIQNISYSLHSFYAENYNNSSRSWYELNNWMSASGASVGGKFGLIYRPVNSLRIGLAWHTPTWVAITETYKAELLEDMESFVPEYVAYENGGFHTAEFLNDYDLTTPGKIVASVATVLGNNFIASLDYEAMDYGKMKLKVPTNSSLSRDWYDFDNEVIEKDHKLTSTVRVGTEYRFTPQFSGRLGYAWMQNPYQADFVKLGYASIAGSNTIFRMEGDTHYFTGGFGYRFNRNVYLDMAVMYKTQKDDLYPFPNTYDGADLIIDAAPFSLKNSAVRGLLTLGYRF